MLGATNFQHQSILGRRLSRAELKSNLRLAASIHDCLFPEVVPAMPGLDMWAIARPAHHVGGDFYDFIERPGSPMTFVVGDISGKGMAAAMLMAMARTIIRMYASSDEGLSSEMILRKSNRSLYADFTRMIAMATVFVGQYDAVERSLVFANAGHSPVIYHPVNGEPRLLLADGMPLGVLPDMLSQDEKICFAPGDVLIIGTDGFIEARNDKGQLFGYDQLLQLVGSLSDRPAGEIGRQLINSIEMFGGGKLQEDDQTLLVLKGVE